jgi:hypothetical protein
MRRTNDAIQPGIRQVCHILVQQNGARLAVSSPVYFSRGRAYLLLEVDSDFRGDAMVEIDPGRLRSPVYFLPSVYVYEGEVKDPRGWIDPYAGPYARP